MRADYLLFSVLGGFSEFCSIKPTCCFWLTANETNTTTMKTKTKKSTATTSKRIAVAPKSTKKSTPTPQPANAREAKPTFEITTERISICAHAIWEEQGRPQGRELEHWLQAESQLKASQSFAA